MARKGKNSLETPKEFPAKNANQALNPKEVKRIKSGVKFLK